MNEATPFSRRGFVRFSAMAAASAATAGTMDAADAPPVSCHPLLTPADDFYDVSRGNPKPFTLAGEALRQARLTQDTWRLEIVADPATSDTIKEPAEAARQFTLDGGTALDFTALAELGRKHAVRYLKAMQCLNIPEPLGQGLWEGVPLREVLRLCGRLRNVRRIFYHGFHNDDPRQLFQSSLSYSQVMETPPGEPPVFLAWRLNGEPISVKRGGPVRLVVPWAHGFKSIKWLHRITLTNDFRANDTYANQNNDPESPLKTAAYIDKAEEKVPSGRPLILTGRVISGLSGLARVEYWVRPVDAGSKPVGPDDAAFQNAPWRPCRLEEAPADWSRILPAGVSPSSVFGFDPRTGRPSSWPLRYTMISWSAVLTGLGPGKYEFRARAVDANGFAQPEPRPILKAGKNGVEMRAFEVV